MIIYFDLVFCPPNNNNTNTQSLKYCEETLCSSFQLGNNHCDPECQNLACGWDSGTDNADKGTSNQLKMGTAQPTNNNYVSKSDCGAMIAGTLTVEKDKNDSTVEINLTACAAKMIGNYLCDVQCQNSKSNWDVSWKKNHSGEWQQQKDCVEYQCAQGCLWQQTHDGVCQADCAVLACDNDDGDCCSPN